MRLPKPIIGCTAALALVLAGCDANIEPTDLSVVTVEKDKSAIEQSLGQPDQLVKSQGFTVASYTYDTGYHAAAPAAGTLNLCSGGGGPYGGACIAEFFVLLIALSVQQAEMSSDADVQQKRRLAAIFDANDKLLFAGSLNESETTTESLTQVAARYKEARNGDEASLIYLGQITLIPQQKQTFLETAANSGSAEAAFELGQAYSRGAGVEPSDTEALKWWLKAGRQDYIPAYKQLGKAYQSGNGVERDLEQAKDWFTKAANNGDEEAAEIAADLKVVLSHIDGTTPEAKYAMALAYERGDVLPVNFPKAERLLQESAEAGYAPAQALYGDRIHDNPVEALNWHRLAAEQGYAPSQTYIGLKHTKGDGGLSQSNAEARKWFNLAAAQGDKDAIKALKILASNEERVSKLRVTAQQGDADSQRLLGLAYQNGEGVEYDVNEALHWYERAAASGDADSQILLGWLHGYSTDIEHDLITALKWYSIAYLDLSVAKTRTASLRKRMTSAQIAEAERLAREWQEAHPQ